MSASAPSEWWSFERYGRKNGGAMARLEATIDQLALSSMGSRSKDRPPAPAPPANLPPEVELPVLLKPGDPALAAARTPKAGGGGGIGSASRVGEVVRPDSAHVRSHGLQRRGSAMRIGADPDELDDDLERGGPLTDAERQRMMEEEAFNYRPLVQVNRVVRAPASEQLELEQQVYGMPHLIVEGAPVPAVSGTAAAADSASATAAAAAVAAAAAEDGLSTDNAMVYDPVADGFAYESRPDIPFANRQALETRLTREDRARRVFFQSGGGDHKQLVMESYPVDERLLRAANVELYKDEPLLRTKIVPPAPYTGKDAWYSFDIQLHAVTFTHHALFTKEDILCRELEEQYKEYKRRETIDLVRYFDGLITGLRMKKKKQIEALEALEKQTNPPPDPDQRVILQSDLLHTLNLLRDYTSSRDREEYEQRTLFQNLYNKWMDIRLARAEITKLMKERGMWQGELKPSELTEKEAQRMAALQRQQSQIEIMQSPQPQGSPPAAQSNLPPKFGRQSSTAVAAQAQSQPLLPQQPLKPQQPIQMQQQPQQQPMQMQQSQQQSQQQQQPAYLPYPPQSGGFDYSSHPGLSAPQQPQQPQFNPSQSQSQSQQLQSSPDNASYSYSSYNAPPPQLDVASPMGTMQFASPSPAGASALNLASPSGALSDTLSSPTAATDAANQIAYARWQQQQQGQQNQPQSFMPPPPPPPPPEMPAPPAQSVPEQAAALLTKAQLEQRSNAQQQQAPPMLPAYAQQQQQQQAYGGQGGFDASAQAQMAAEYQRAQYEYEAQLAAAAHYQYTQQQPQQSPQHQLAQYQQALAPQTPSQGIGIMGQPKPQEESKEQQQQPQLQALQPQQPQQQNLQRQPTVQFAASPSPSPSASPDTPGVRKGQHITTQEALLESQARMQRERQAKEEDERRVAVGGPAGLSVNTAASEVDAESASYNALTTRRALTDLKLGKRPGLLKETYIGYPAVLKVGKKECHFKEPAKYPLEYAQYVRDSNAWNAALDAEVEEIRLREKLERALNPPAVPVEPLSPASQLAADMALRKTLERQKASMRRRPGGTIYLPTLHGADDLGGGTGAANGWFRDPARCLPEEARRRTMIESYQIYLRLFVNGQKVADTPLEPLSFPRFRAQFDTTFPLHLVAHPSSITVQIIHKRGLTSADERLAEVFLPVPKFGAPPSKLNLDFSGSDPLSNDPSRVIYLDPSPGAPSRFIHGVLEATVYWKPSESGEDLDEFGHARGPEGMSKALQALTESDHGRRGISNKMAEMTRAAAAARGGGGLAGALNPNDPRNKELLERMRRQEVESTKGGGGLAAASGRAQSSKQVFRISEFQADTLLINEKYFVSSARRKVLQARNESTALRDPVPLRDEDIPPALYSFIEVEHLSEERRKALYAHVGASPQALEQMYATAAWREKSKILNIQHDVYSVAEVVNEVALPSFEVDFKVLDRLFEPRRALKPKREVHKAIAAPKSCNVVIQVVKGQNLPVRRDPKRATGAAMAAAGFGGGSGTSSSNISALSLEHQQNVRTFVEIRLQDNSRRTSVATGSNPRWDQLVSLPFHPPAGSFAPSYLSSVQDEIYFNVFDQVSSVSAEHKTSHTKISRTEPRWLGSFSIPFTTIYAHGRVDGAFQLRVPLLHLGYEQPHPDRSAFLYIYATLDPLLTPPPVAPEHFQHINPFYARAIKWVQDLKAIGAHTAGRDYSAVVGDINGAPQFLTRYVCAQRPPEGYTAPRIFSRFVSIIPFLEDAQVSQGAVKDIWCNSKEFLTLAGGDWEEHAILLNNYYTWYDATVADASSRHQNYVALGTGFPEGDTAYVLRLGVQGGTIVSKLLINAVTGDSYDLLDVRQRESCPMQSISVLFNADNIWANIQVEDDPVRMSFELFNPQMWAAFFTAAGSHSSTGGGSFTAHMASQMYGMKFDTIQKSITYTEEPMAYYTDRANKIERLIERRFEKWRPSITRWDYGVSKILRDFLLTFEMHEQKEDGVALQLERPLVALTAAYPAGVYGFPLHFSDSGDSRMLESSDENPLVKSVMNTRIHESEDSNAVFALAVYIHPYPNRMGSVWMYVACLTDSR